jgi:hypothetical protein
VVQYAVNFDSGWHMSFLKVDSRLSAAEAQSWNCLHVKLASPDVKMPHGRIVGAHDLQPMITVFPESQLRATRLSISLVPLA